MWGCECDVSGFLRGAFLAALRTRSSSCSLLRFYVVWCGVVWARCVWVNCWCGHVWSQGDGGMLFFAVCFRVLRACVSRWLRRRPGFARAKSSTTATLGMAMSGDEDMHTTPRGEHAINYMTPQATRGLASQEVPFSPSPHEGASGLSAHDIPVLPRTLQALASGANYMTPQATRGPASQEVSETSKATSPASSIQADFTLRPSSAAPSPQQPPLTFLAAFFPSPAHAGPQAPFQVNSQVTAPLTYYCALKLCVFLARKHVLHSCLGAFSSLPN